MEICRQCGWLWTAARKYEMVMIFQRLAALFDTHPHQNRGQERKYFKEL